MADTQVGAARGEMTRDEILEMFARRQDAYDDLDAAGLAADYADDVVIDSPFSGRHGKAACTQNFTAFFKAFLDVTMKTDELIVDGTHVAQVLTVEGTNMGGVFGLPPSGKSFAMSAVFIYELRGRKIIRERRVYDFTGLMVQVGVLKAKPV